MSTKLAKIELGREAMALDFLSLSVLDETRKSDGNRFVSDYSVEEDHSCRKHDDF